MKKRITCMLLALCMVLAAVPAAVAAPVVEDQIDVSLLEKQLGNESQLLQRRSCRSCRRMQQSLWMRRRPAMLRFSPTLPA